MSYQLIATGGKTSYNKDDFVVDTYEDLQTIPVHQSAVGSTVFVIEGSRVFMLNSQKEWKEI